jgi:hypothetical protein
MLTWTVGSFLPNLLFCQNLFILHSWQRWVLWPFATRKGNHCHKGLLLVGGCESCNEQNGIHQQGLLCCHHTTVFPTNKLETKLPPPVSMFHWLKIHLSSLNSMLPPTALPWQSWPVHLKHHVICIDQLQGIIIVKLDLYPRVGPPWGAMSCYLDFHVQEL